MYTLRQFSGLDFDQDFFCLIEFIWGWEQYNYEFSLIMQMALFTIMFCVNVYSY